MGLTTGLVAQKISHHDRTKTERHGQPSRCQYQMSTISKGLDMISRISLQGRFRAFSNRLEVRSALELCALTTLRRSARRAEQMRVEAGRWIEELLPDVTLLLYPASRLTSRASLGVWKRTRWILWVRQLVSAGQMETVSGLSNQLDGERVKIERVVPYRLGARGHKRVAGARAIRRLRRRPRLLGA